MGRKYNKKTTRGVDIAQLVGAAKLVAEGKSSTRKAAKAFDVPNTTFQRYLNSSEEEKKEFGYTKCRSANMVFTIELEQLLATHVKDMDNRYHGLSVKKCTELAYEFAIRNHLSVPNSWVEKHSAGWYFVSCKPYTYI